MARCEDFPCCGHAGDPGGCPDYDTVRICKQCGRKFHPDNLTYDYCYACQTLDENGECMGCGGHGCPECL